MAYYNNGYQRATTLTIQVKQNGVVTATNVLPFMSQFTYNGVTYETKTTTGIARMTTAEYNARVAAYAAYVTANYQSQYPGLTVSTAGARVENQTACPLSF